MMVVGQSRSRAGKRIASFVCAAVLGVSAAIGTAQNAVEGWIPDFVSAKKDEVAHQQALIQAGWRLVWQDEFEGSHISPHHWSHEVNCAGGGNNEYQCYTEREENSYVDSGLLHIVAREEYPGGYTGPAIVDDDPAYPGAPDTWRTQPYSSARLRTKDKFDFTYGRVEVRAKLAGGQGMWPAIWMLPTDWAYGGWPSSGEIDIVEGVNLGLWGNEVHGTLHYGLPWPQWENHGQTLYMSENPSDDFHVYAVEWEADEIRWYVDGVHYQTQQSSGWYNYIWQGQDNGFGVATPRAPFDQRFHLIMNLAVGGDWPGAPDTGWPEDREMLVDYVRVYQCHQPDIKPRRHQAGYEGKGCATIDPSVQVHADIGTPGVNEFTLYADGPATLDLEVNGQQVQNTPVPGQWELVSGNVYQDVGDFWSVQFNGLGNVFLASQDMGAYPFIDNGVALAGGAGWTNNGEIQFDLRVLDASPGARLLVKMDSGYPKLGQVEIELPPADGFWYPVSVRVADILANPLQPIELSNVLNLFVLEHPQEGEYVHVELDNIRLKCAYNTEPESWQQDKFCNLSARESQIALESPVGFERSSESYQFANFAGGEAWLVDNPDSDGNGSDKVAIMQKFMVQNEWETWGGTTLSLNRQVDVPDNASFSMKVWSQREVKVLFKLEAPLPGEAALEVEVVHSGNGWEELSFDFDATPNISKTDKLTLIFDLGTMGDAGGDPVGWTFYFDDIEI
jgi:beta-glucanase (GH16 family)